MNLDDFHNNGFITLNPKKTIGDGLIFDQNEFNEIIYLDYFSEQVEKIENIELLTPNSHKSWWSGNKISQILKSIGFQDVKIVERRFSREKVFKRKIFNNTWPEMSFFVEAVK